MPRTISSFEVAQAAIELALKDIAPRWKADTIAAYEKAAQDEHAGALAWLTDADEAKAKRWYDNKPSFRFVGLSKAEQEKYEHDYRTPYFDRCRRAAIGGGLVCLIEEARQAGAFAYEQAHHDFVFRGAGKISDVFGPGAELTVTCDLKYRPGGAIEGLATASSGAGTLVVVVSVMTNYRYGENAADGVLTVYGQYPMRVVSVVDRGGAKFTRNAFSSSLSLEEAAVLISGRNPIAEKRRAVAELKAKKQQRGKDLWELEKRKRAWGEIASWYRWNEVQTNYQTDEIRKRAVVQLAELCTKHGVADPGSKKAANEKIKELREQMKQLKGRAL